jgi:hypothetical protein
MLREVSDAYLLRFFALKMQRKQTKGESQGSSIQPSVGLPV